MRKKTFFLWILAVLITLAAVVFQRMTGPTNPKHVKFNWHNTEYKTKLPRSINIKNERCSLKFRIEGLPSNVAGTIFIRKYKTNERFTAYTPEREGDRFFLRLPAAPAAAKIEYYLLFVQSDGDTIVAQEEPIVARFKNDVPAALMIPHILLMFAAMLLSNLSGLMAFIRREQYLHYAKIAFVCLLTGGLLFGCIIQKIAFGQYWTGFPFGGDLTDNKTLLALIVWVIAIAANYRVKKHPLWVVIAAVFMLLVYSVPHSALGSEYNYQTQEVQTGM